MSSTDRSLSAFSASIVKVAAPSVLLAAAIAGAPALAADKLPAGDPVNGQKVFNQCKICHSLDAGKNLIGPSLNKMIGQKAGDVAGYQFSPAMKKAGLTWTPATLSEFLTAPMKKVPGTKMTFAGLSKPQDRADVIAYMAKN